jgi:hypothetical protein
VDAGVCGHFARHADAVDMLAVGKNDCVAGGT